MYTSTKLRQNSIKAILKYTFRLNDDLWKFRNKSMQRTLRKHESSLKLEVNHLQNQNSSPINCLIRVNHFRIAVGSEDFSIKICTIVSRLCVLSIDAHNGSVNAMVKIAPNLIASGSSDFKIKIWDFNTGENQGVMIGHKGSVVALAFFRKKYLISGSEDTFIKIWNPNTLECLFDTSLNLSAISSVASIGKSSYFIVSSLDKTIALYKMKGHVIDCHYQVQTISSIQVMIKFNSKLLLCGYDEGIILAYTIKTGSFVRSFEGHVGSVISLLALNSLLRNVFASSGIDLTIRLWNVQNGQCWKVLSDARAIHPSKSMLLIDQRTLGCSSSNTYSINLWNIETGKMASEIANHSSLLRSILRISITEIATGSEDGMIMYWTLFPIRNQRKFLEHKASITQIINLPSKRLASSSEDKTIKIWDLLCEKSIATLEGHLDKVYSLAKYQEVGRCDKLISSSGDRTLKIWSISNLTCLETVIAHTGPIMVIVKLSKTGLCSGSWDNTIKIWEIEPDFKFREETTLLGHEGPISAFLKLNPTILVSASWDHSIRLWDIKEYMCIKVYSEHEGPVYSLCRVTSKIFLSGSYDTFIKTWNIESSKSEQTIDVCKSPVSFMIIMNNSQMLIVGWSDPLIVFDFK